MAVKGHGAAKVFRVFPSGSDQCYRSDPGLLCASQLGKRSGAVDREGNRLGCEAGRDSGADPGGDRDFSGFDQFRYCNSQTLWRKKAAVLVLSAGSSRFRGDGSGISIYYGGDRAFTGDPLGFACRYYQ